MVCRKELFNVYANIPCLSCQYRKECFSVEKKYQHGGGLFSINRRCSVYEKWTIPAIDILKDLPQWMIDDLLQEKIVDYYNKIIRG